MNTHREPAWLAQALGPIAKVRPGEAVTALLLSLNVFLLLCAYYVIKPVREALILALASGAEYKSYMSGAIALLLLALVPAYAKCVDRLPRLELVVGVTLFFAVNLLLFFGLMQSPRLAPHLGLLFYAWVGVFNLMVVAQFWSFASDLYDPERGARLFPMVALGASFGAALGSQLAATLIPLLGIPAMLLAAMSLLCACAGLYYWVEKRERRVALTAGQAPPMQNAKAGAEPTHQGAFQLVLGSRYLLLVALFSMIFSWVNSNGEYLLGKLIQRDAVAAVQAGLAHDVGARIGERYAQFFFYVNALGLFLQSFVVSRLVRWLGFRACFVIFPIIALCDASAFALAPLLATITIGKTAENATDYSLNNTLRQMLWLVTSHDMKYKAKQAVDTFFVRMGDLASAGTVMVAAGWLALSVRQIALVNWALVLVWLALALAIGKEHARLSAGGQHAPVPRARLGRWRSVLGLGALAGLVCWPARAFAADAPREPDQDRTPPNYDGRGRPASPARALLWVPRVVFFPAYVVTEYGVRRPLGAAITAAERHGVPSLLYELFTFGPDHQAGIVPIAFLDFGFRPSVGVYGFWDGVGVKIHSLRARASTGGPDWLAFASADRWALSKHFELGTSNDIQKRPDYTFYGIGSDTPESALSRYGATTWNVRLNLRTSAGSSFIETTTGYRRVRFRTGGFGDDTTLAAAAADGRWPLPPGYADGYQAPVITSTVVLDSRPVEARSETGARLELSFEEGADLRRHSQLGWVRYGATAGVFYDVGGRGRVFSLSASTELSDPLGSRQVPFTELTTLGGAAKMPGFREGRLRGRSSAVATLRYSWPIWMWLDGSLQAAVGNVFGEHLEGASLERSRFSGAIGIEGRGSRDNIFQMLLGFGTETFDSGASVNAPRIVIGARRGF